MTKFDEGYFYNPSQGNLNLDQVMTEISRYMNEKPERFYDVIVGCDSSSGDDPRFPVVVVVLRVGEGGRFFIKKINYPLSLRKKFKNWHRRILEEVLLSCQLALFLREKLAKRLDKSSKPLNYQFRYIHADIGERGQTRDMIREIIGLIRGNGFEPKIKPESFVASTVADRFS